MSMFGGWRRRGPGVIPALVAAITILVLLASASGLGVAAPGPARSLATPDAALDSTPTQSDVAAAARTFPTGYPVQDDRIWDYFQRRGGVRTFGMPVSNVFRLQGTPVQIFQRHVLQVQAGGGVTVLNLLDGFLPYARFNGSTIPQADPQLLAQSPRPDGQAYPDAALNFVQLHAPDTWNGMPVNFQRAFMQTVTCADAYPDGGCREDLLPLLNLEIWGLPTSAPQMDPANNNFVYQRFQRGVFMYDASSGLTRPMLLADYFKSVLTGVNLPYDLKADAQGSPYALLFDPNAPDSTVRAAALPSTDLRGAFNGSDLGGALLRAATLEPTIPSEFGPTDEPFPTFEGEVPTEEGIPTEEGAPTSELFETPQGLDQTPQVPTDIAISAATGTLENPSQCLGDERISVVPPNPRAGDNVLIAVTSAKRHVFTQLFGTEKVTKLREDPRSGQLGWVWEWTLTPGFDGRQIYTFYIDSTVPCATTSFKVGEALATLTPEPTSTERPTRTPTETPTPTETRTPAPVAAQSRVVLSKGTLRLDRSDTVTATAFLVDRNGNPVTNVLVEIRVSPDSLAFRASGSQPVQTTSIDVDQQNFRTDSEGAVRATLIGCADTSNAPQSTPFFVSTGTDRATVQVSATFTDQNGNPAPIGSAKDLTVVLVRNNSC